MLRGRPYDSSHLKVKKQPQRRGQVACSQAACEWWSSGAMAARAEGGKRWHRLSRGQDSLSKAKEPWKGRQETELPMSSPGPPLTSAFPIHPKIQGMLDQVRCCEGPRRRQEVHARLGEGPGDRKPCVQWVYLWAYFWEKRFLAFSSSRRSWTHKRETITVQNNLSFLVQMWLGF